ncbi:MAG: DUF4390 domain-containing protein [Neisseriaceae bacterium]|nr:DUF4390 domain-containing protein [Neisseriaceae bacterium]
MPCWKKIKYFLALLLIMCAFPAVADNIRAIKAEGVKLPNGTVSVETLFYTTLPEQLQDALKQGVPLQFDLTYQLTRPSLMAYKFRFNRLFANDNVISYRLTYHALTERYRVSTGTFYTEYQNLNSALKALGATSNWQTLPEGTLKNNLASDDIGMSVRLSLTTRQLPKPFQINALTSDDWNLDSGWVQLKITWS